MFSKKTRLIAVLLLAVMALLTIPVVSSAETEPVDYTQIKTLYAAPQAQFCVPYYSKSNEDKDGRKGDPQTSRLTLSKTYYQKFADGGKAYLDFDFLVTENTLFGGVRLYDDNKKKEAIISLSTINVEAAKANPWTSVLGWHHLTAEIWQPDGNVKSVSFKLYADGVVVQEGSKTFAGLPFFVLNDGVPAAAAGSSGFYLYLGSTTAVDPSKAKANMVTDLTLGVGTEDPYLPTPMTYVTNGGAFEKDITLSYDSTGFDKTIIPYDPVCTDGKYEYSYSLKSSNVKHFYTADSTFEDLPTPVKEGYVFTGWYTDYLCTEKVTADNFAAVFADGKGKTLFAGWSTSNGVDGMSVTLNEDLSLNLFVNAELAGGETLTAKFTKNGATTEAQGTVLGTEAGVTSLKFTVADIGPQNAADEITADFYVGDAKKFSATVSVYEYLKTIHDYETDEKTLALADALLAYTKAATAFVGKATTAYTVTLSDVPAATGTAATPVNAGAAVIKSANVYFDNQNKLVVKYESASAVATKIDGVDVTPVSLGDNIFTIETDGIVPTDFDKVFTFTVGESTLAYSVNTYAAAMKDNAQIGALTNALYAYGVAAEAYIAE